MNGKIKGVGTRTANRGMLNDKMKKKIIKSSKQVEKENSLKMQERTCPECGEWYDVLVTARETKKWSKKWCFLLPETEPYYICRGCGCEWRID